MHLSALWSQCTIGFNELVYGLAMGQQPTEEELFQMISEVDEDMSGAIGIQAARTLLHVVSRTHYICIRLC